MKYLASLVNFSNLQKFRELSGKEVTVDVSRAQQCVVPVFKQRRESPEEALARYGRICARMDEDVRAGVRALNALRKQYKNDYAIFNTWDYQLLLHGSREFRRFCVKHLHGHRKHIGSKYKGGLSLWTRNINHNVLSEKDKRLVGQIDALIEKVEQVHRLIPTTLQY